MKVLLSQLGTAGGGPRLLYEIAGALAAKPEVEVHLTSYRGSELVDLVDGLGLPACDAPADPPSRARAAWANVRYSASIARYARRHGISAALVVMGSPRQILPALALRVAGVTVIGGRHDAAPHDGEATRAITAVHMFLQPHLSHGLLTFSHATAELLRAKVKHPERVYETVHAAFGGDIAPPAARAVGTPVQIGFFGRIVAYKGLDRLVEAVRLLQADGMAVALQVHGRGPMSESLTTALDEVGATIDNRWIDDDQVPKVVDGYDVLALPYDEASQSGVVGYAMRLGIPVVATPLDGLAEQVTEPGVGVLAEDMTPQAFAEALRRVAEDERLYEELSAAGPVAAHTTFGWDRVADDIVAAVTDLLRRRGRR